MEKQIFSDFIDKYRDAEMVVIGIGEEWNAYLEKQEYQDLLAFYAPYLEKKNYFCITSSKKNDFSWGSLNPKRVVQPLLLEAEQITSEKKEEVEKQWDLYNKWLSATLNKKLMLIELGEGFLIPNLIRWPFERSHLSIRNLCYIALTDNCRSFPRIFRSVQLQFRNLLMIFCRN